ncbi:hypothetical protein ACFL1M_03975 [Patescibacteria group bacterium]
MLVQKKEVLSMHNFVRNTQYLSPKWRAYVTPRNKAFLFSNGLSVKNLWELKQAFLAFTEDVINVHIGDGSNHIADWVEHVVGDKDLADELRNYSHRWGLIVALERQMMRTLNLPDYVAKRWLREVTSPFSFSNGVEIRSINDLKESIDSLPEDVLKFHYERHPNDLSVWLSDVVGDYYLAESLEEVNSKEQVSWIISDHLEMLEEAVS